MGGSADPSLSARHARAARSDESGCSQGADQEAATVDQAWSGGIGTFLRWGSEQGQCRQRPPTACPFGSSRTAALSLPHQSVPGTPRGAAEGRAGSGQAARSVRRAESRLDQAPLNSSRTSVAGRKPAPDRCSGPRGRTRSSRRGGRSDPARPERVRPAARRAPRRAARRRASSRSSAPRRSSDRSSRRARRRRSAASCSAVQGLAGAGGARAEHRVDAECSRRAGNPRRPLRPGPARRLLSGRSTSRPPGWEPSASACRNISTMRPWSIPPPYRH